ncbi:MAG: sigma-54-dependent Fis family transcriptional regulator, partial [Spirochaetes bacterium]
MAEKATILLIDDKENIRTVMSELLRSEGWTVFSATNGREGLSKAIHHEPDVIVSDIRMDDIDGVELFHLLRSRGYAIPFIFVTAYGTVEEAVSMLKEGAVHYLTKPVNHSDLKMTIHSILKSNSAAGTTGSRRLVGSSFQMESVYGRIASLARSNSTVLISGESGTGKELIARAIHEQSRRRHNHFVPVN